MSCQLSADCIIFTISRSISVLVNVLSLKLVLLAYTESACTLQLGVISCYLQVLCIHKMHTNKTNNRHVLINLHHVKMLFLELKYGLSSIPM